MPPPTETGNIVTTYVILVVLLISLWILYSGLVQTPVSTATLMALAALGTARAAAGYAYHQRGGAYANGLGAYGAAGGPLTVLAEAPYAVDGTLAAVPLVAVPSSQLRVLHDARIAAVSPTRPVVTLQAPEREATPAVRVVLARPMVVSAPQSTISFPASFTVVHQGLRMPIPVGAVLAPVPGGAFVSAQHPYTVRVVYAVPTGPLPFAYPFHTRYPAYPTYPSYPSYPSYPTYPAYSPPLYIGAGPGTAVALPVRPVRPVRPVGGPSSPAPPAAQPALPSRPQQQRPDRPPLVSSGRPVVTVLDFPTAVASPPVLVVQRPAYGQEDEGLGAPQAVAPAGIVQSTQPRPVQSVFTNSKDNEFLQQMREQAALDAAAGAGATPLADFNKIVEVLYN